MLLLCHAGARYTRGDAGAAALCRATAPRDAEEAPRLLRDSVGAQARPCALYARLEAPDVAMRALRYGGATQRYVSAKQAQRARSAAFLRACF